MPAMLVTGATGQQGGAVIDALLAMKPASLEVRALTRNPSSEKAKELESRGVTLVRGDLENRDSVEGALQGCDSAYLVTDFRGPRDIEGEIDQGRSFVDLAKSLG
jgi:uncharacterized protein YbjT (DUF2867 family)